MNDQVRYSGSVSGALISELIATTSVFAERKHECSGGPCAGTAIPRATS